MMARTAVQVRLAIGLLTASEWDHQAGGSLDTMRAYMDGCETETAEDMIRGLVVVCRALMGNLAEERQMTLPQVIRHTAERVAAWQQ